MHGVLFRLTLIAMAPAIPLAAVVIFIADDRCASLRQALLDVAAMWAELYRAPF